LLAALAASAASAAVAVIALFAVFPGALVASPALATFAVFAGFPVLGARVAFALPVPFTALVVLLAGLPESSARMNCSCSEPCLTRSPRHGCEVKLGWRAAN
jgi:hypothetical protein